MRDRFWLGFAGGWLAALAVVAAAVYRLATQGLVLSVDTEAVAARVEQEVRAEVQRELPGALRRARRELPGLVAAEVARRLSAGKVQVGAVEVEIPPSLRRELARRLTDELTRAGDDLLQRVDVSQAATQAGKVARGLVEARLRSQLDGYRLVLRPLPWLAVPVTVRPQP